MDSNKDSLLLESISRWKLRRTGRTTRIIDEAIQNLFAAGKCQINDHHYGKETDSFRERDEAHRRANQFAFKILLRRLDLEHGGLDQFKIDKDRFIVELVIE